MVIGGMNFSASVAGSEIRHIKCVQCGCEYVYVAYAAGSGKSSTFSLLQDQDAAAARARVEARAEMKRNLRKTIPAVACPDCGWYQPDMIRSLRRKRLSIGAIIASLPLVW